MVSKRLAVFLCALILLQNYVESSAENENSSDVDHFDYGEMRIYSNPLAQLDSKLMDVCVYYYPKYLNLTTNVVYKLEDRTSVDPCRNNPDILEIFGNDTLLLMRLDSLDSNCSILPYMNYTKNNGAAGLVLISKSLNISNLNISDYDFNFQVFAVVGNTTGSAISGIEKGPIYVTLETTKNEYLFEASILVLLLLACFCVAVGAGTGPFYNGDWKSATHDQILDGDEQTPVVAAKNEINFTVPMILGMVAFITTILVLLYFFFEYLVYFFRVVFCIASGRAVFEIILQVLSPCHLDAKMPRIKGFGVHRCIISLICVGLVVTDFLLRHDEQIWILDDFLGVCFCIHLIQSFKLTSLKKCTILLSLLFVYDIFFVFVTPYITSDGKSVMVEVATGGKGGSSETLPILLRIPHLKEISACNVAAFSLLGFGDIILPGFLVCFMHTFDIMHEYKRKPYFATSMLGYICGLSTALAALFISKTAQPALLYIVPFLLIPIFIVGVCRKEFNMLWIGFPTIDESNCKSLDTPHQEQEP